MWCSAGGNSTLVDSKGTSPEIQDAFAIPKGAKAQGREGGAAFPRGRERARGIVTGVTRVLRRWHAREKGERVGLFIA